MAKRSIESSEYGDFAWFFNRYWNEDFHSLAFPVLERIWLPRVPADGRVLDVCCGTGHLAGLLTRRGFRVTGVDMSEEMIACARTHLPQGDFHVADATAFTLPRRYDAAVSTFDSLNHILTAEGLAAAFRNTSAALKPGALFVFDVLFEEAYRTHWGEAFAIVRDDHVLTITGSRYDARSRIARCLITMFRRVKGEWRRADVEVRERCHRAAEIDTALDQAGFDGVACYSAADLGMAGELGADRTFYLATKTR